MIMLAFMHMMRGYFVSVHKKPRELMWLTGMVMGFVTLGFGFTGYLLPWTVVSKSATDVGIGIVDALPAPVSSFVSFLIVGAGGDATELLRFYDLHVVVLPAVLLVLLTVKMWMLETHGIGEPTCVPSTSKSRVALPIFPDVTVYLLELAAMFGSAMLLLSVILPLKLPPEYTPQLAAQYTPQPDWYFLWIYQVLKISVFEGAGLPVALTLVTLVFLALFLLPFIDKGSERKLTSRPKFVTIGLIFIAELLVLTYWGLITPGQVIPIENALLVLGGTAVLVGAAALGMYSLLGARGKQGHSLLTSSTGTKTMSFMFRRGVGMTLFIALGSLAIGTSLNQSVSLILNGVSMFGIIGLMIAIALFAAAALGTAFFIYRLESESGSLKRKINFFEVGWGKLDTS
jgi:quinol-cytochrome oxidoreductase complex cytochrome b subunit